MVIAPKDKTTLVTLTFGPCLFQPRGYIYVNGKFIDTFNYNRRCQEILAKEGLCKWE